jgi:hypothetical protein
MVEERRDEVGVFRVGGDLLMGMRQEVTLFELRAATSLPGLWPAQGKRAEARDLLAPVYNWFSKVFDTPDLKGAKPPLDSLH